MFETIVNTFNEHLETVSRTIEPLTPLIADAGEMMATTLLNDNKIICCANGPSAHTASLFTSYLLNRFEQERPSLPALTLSLDGATLSGIAQDSGINELYAKQIRALGQPGDLLLSISPTGEAGNLAQAIRAARDREMTVVVFSGADGGDLGALLSHEDLELRIPAINKARIRETHLLIVHCLCAIIDQQLFGHEV